MKTYEIWSEGYSATGESAGAMLHAKIEAESFDDAVREYKRRDREADKYISFQSGQWDYWGCRLFDNERAARSSFG